MSSLSRTIARASRRGKKLMEQYQPPGAYRACEKWHRKVLEARRDRRGRLALSGPVGINVARLLGIELPPIMSGPEGGDSCPMT
jgi:hypothetical protein